MTVGLKCIPHLKPIWSTSKLKIEMQIELKLYIFQSIQQLRQIAALKHKLLWETGLSNTSLLELVEHGLGPVGLGHVGEAVQVDSLDGRDGRDPVAWKKQSLTECLFSWVSGLSTERGVLSVAIFFYVFPCGLRGPAWEVGSYSISQSDGGTS